MSATASRIPVYNSDPYMWFKAMRDLGLIFHPEDDPATIVIGDPKAQGPKFFTQEECEYLRNVMRSIRRRWGDPCEFAYQLAVDCGDIT